MIEHEIEGGGLLLEQRQSGPFANLRFQTAASEGALNSAIGEKECLGAFFLRARTFHTRNNGKSKRLLLFDGGNHALKDRFHISNEAILHKLARSVRQIF